MTAEKPPEWSETIAEKLAEGLPVRGDTDPRKLASTVAKAIRDGLPFVRVRCLGVGPVSVCAEAWTIARGFLEADGLGLVERPSLVHRDIEGQDWTVMIITVEPYRM